MRRPSFAILTLVLMSVSAAQATDNLCNAGETTIFACRMGRTSAARTAALCADEATKPWQLRYRFGTPGHIELAYPAAGETPAFRHQIISYSSIGGDAILFDHGGASYALFYVLGHDTDFAGVSVRKGDKEVANLSCAEGSIDEMTTDFVKGARLPDADGQFEVPSVFFDRQRQRR